MTGFGTPGPVSKRGPVWRMRVWEGLPCPVGSPKEAVGMEKAGPSNWMFRGGRGARLPRKQVSELSVSVAGGGPRATAQTRARALRSRGSLLGGLRCPQPHIVPWGRLPETLARLLGRSSSVLVWHGGGSPLLGALVLSPSFCAPSVLGSRTSGHLGFSSRRGNCPWATPPSSLQSVLWFLLLPSRGPDWNGKAPQMCPGDHLGAGGVTLKACLLSLARLIGRSGADTPPRVPDQRRNASPSLTVSPRIRGSSLPSMNVVWKGTRLAGMAARQTIACSRWPCMVVPCICRHGGCHHTSRTCGPLEGAWAVYAPIGAPVPIEAWVAFDICIFALAPALALAV